MSRFVKYIPNAITSLNLLFGFMAIIFAVDGHLIWAGIFICISAVLDFLDGFAARFFKAWSDIGKQLDSFADLISFGVAPAAILMTLIKFSMFEGNLRIYEISADSGQWLILLLPLLMPLAGAFRLARYNVAQSDLNYFSGLPIPANGIFWASLGLMLQFPPQQELIQIIFSTKTLLLLGLLTSVMMVSTLPMFSLKMKSGNLKENWYRYLYLLIAVVLIVVFKVYGLAITILLYILLNIIFYLTGVKYETSI